MPRRFSADLLRQARKHRQLSREQLAVGAAVGMSSLVRYEQGNRRPGADVLARLADHLAIPIDDLFEDDSAGRDAG